MLERYAPGLNLRKFEIFEQSKEVSDSQQSFELTILTQFYPPDYAATGQLIEELAIQLGRLGINVQVFTGQPGYAFRKSSAPAKEKIHRVLVQRSRTSRLYPARIRGKAINGILFFIRCILHIFKNAGCSDILLLTSAPPFLPIVGYIAKLFFGTSYICLLYDLYPDVAVELNLVSRKHPLVRLWNWLNKQVWKNADEIIVLSSTMQERIQAKCPEVSDKISVIHNWANPNSIVPIAKHNNWFALKHNLVEKFTVLYSGNMGRCHEMDTILEAAMQLQDEPIQFVFIGGGAKQQSCVAQVKKLGLSNCQFLPYQDKQDLRYSLTACDLSLVSISPGMEGVIAPSKLYGILAAGRPVAAICEENSYLRSLIAKANCGAAFNNGDSHGLAAFVRSLANNKYLAQQMGTAGRSYLESNFTPEIIAKQYSKVLHSAIAKHSVNLKKTKSRIAN